MAECLKFRFVNVYKKLTNEEIQAISIISNQEAVIAKPTSDMESVLLMRRILEDSFDSVLSPHFLEKMFEICNATIQAKSKHQSLYVYSNLSQISEGQAKYILKEVLNGSATVKQLPSLIKAMPSPPSESRMSLQRIRKPKSPQRQDTPCTAKITKEHASGGSTIGRDLEEHQHSIESVKARNKELECQVLKLSQRVEEQNNELELVKSRNTDLVSKEEETTRLLQQTAMSKKDLEARVKSLIGQMNNKDDEIQDMRAKCRQMKETTKRKEQTANDAHSESTYDMQSLPFSLQVPQDDDLSKAMEGEGHEQLQSTKRQKMNTGGEFRVGERVFAIYKKDGKAYPAVIDTIHGTNYTVIFQKDGIKQTMDATSIYNWDNSVKIAT